MRELWLNNQLIDLSDDTVIALTYQVNDLSDIETRNGNYTNQFEIPKTRNNIKVLGDYEVQSNTNTPYTRIAARYIQDGIELIQDGYAVLEEQGENYQITLYSSSSNLFDLIGDEELTTVGDTSVSVWDCDNIAGTFQNDYTDKFIYPLIDYGNLQVTALSFNSHYMFPAFYVRYLFQQIISDAGYTLQGNLLNDERFNNLALAWSKDKWVHSPEYMASVKAVTTEPDTLQSGNIVATPTTAFSLRLKSGTFFNGNTIPNLYLSPNNFYAAKLKFKIIIKYTNVTNDGNLGIQFNLCRSTTNAIVAQSILMTRAITEGVEATYDFEILSNVKLENYYINLACSAAAGVVTDYTITSVDLEITHGDNIKDDATFIIRDQQPKFTKKDFIKSIMQLFGLTQNVNENSKVVTFNSFEDLKLNKHLAKDWSDKIDFSEAPTIIFRDESYGQRNNFTYEYDEGMTVGTHDGYFDIADEVLEKEVDIVNSIYGATPNTMRYYNNAITESFECPQIMKVNDEFNPENETTQRILIIEPTPAPFDIVVQTNFGDVTPDSNGANTGTIVPMCYFQSLNKPYNLDWQTLITDYYTEFAEIFDKVKAITCKFNLNVIDVYNFNHFIPVYFSRFNSYFYVNKINNFKQGELTEVELIKIKI